MNCNPNQATGHQWYWKGSDFVCLCGAIIEEEFALSLDQSKVWTGEGAYAHKLAANASAAGGLSASSPPIPPRPLQVGDRVSVEGFTSFGFFFKERGEIVEFQSHDQVLVLLNKRIHAHVFGLRSCRRLVSSKKKQARPEPRRIYVNEYSNGLLAGSYSTSDSAKVNAGRGAVRTGIEFVEALPNGSGKQKGKRK